MTNKVGHSWHIPMMFNFEGMCIQCSQNIKEILRNGNISYIELLTLGSLGCHHLGGCNQTSTF
jgi:hypothetical protein